MAIGILGIVTIVLGLFLMCVIASVIRKVFIPTTIDEELEEYERLLKEREKRGVSSIRENVVEPSAPVPILTEQEAASVAVLMPIDRDTVAELSDEELLKEAANSDDE